MPDSHTASAVTVRLVYLARLREAFGSSGETLSLSKNEHSIAEILALLRERGGSFAAELAAGRAVRVALNHELVTPDTRARDGDEVALLPPVTGG